jgi:hypothetical protein
MRRLVRELGPLAVGVALFGVVIAWLLQAGNPIGSWLLAAFLIGHGLVHLLFAVPQKAVQPARAGSPEWAFAMDRSWVLGPMGATAGALHGLGMTLMVVTAVAFALAGLASVPLLLPATLWPALIVVAAGASLALMTTFLNPYLVIGIAIDVVLIWVALAAAWLPG